MVGLKARPKEDFESYEHHGRTVTVRKDCKGLHRNFCLCYFCKKFIPGVPEKNCSIANLIYAVCIKCDVVTPVWECPDYEFAAIPFNCETFLAEQSQLTRDDHDESL